RLLHAAYRPLADDGLHYLASRQSDAVTLDRLREGRSWLVFHSGLLAGTVSLYEGAAKRMSCDYYRRPGVWLFGQFAVRPDLQGRGYGDE
ncbi:GNAT family N-acetyltransferase, partial [Acinetobacter baumannii]